jgi:hypothetical protein
MGTSPNQNLAHYLAESPNRRGILKKLGIARAAVAAGGMRSAADPVSPTVVDVLQFALNLEYLEAECYTVAKMGKTIDQVGIGIDGDGTPFWSAIVPNPRLESKKLRQSVSSNLPS